MHLIVFYRSNFAVCIPKNSPPAYRLLSHLHINHIVSMSTILIYE